MPDLIVHEGVYMNYSPEPIFDGWYGTIPGIVIEERSHEPAGMGMEPSGHAFMNHRDTTRYTFHPYTGGKPVPCARPRNYITYQRKD
jgi:hypothetical protein